MFDEIMTNDTAVDKSSSYDMQRLHTRVMELESELERNRVDQEGVISIQDRVRTLTKENESLRSDNQNKNLLIGEYHDENDRLLSQLNASRKYLSHGISAVKETSSQSVEATLGCNTCLDVLPQLERYKESANEASRLGEELSKSLEERDKLKNEVKRLKSSQSKDRIKLVLKENDDLKEALRKRFPSNFTSLVSGSSGTDSELAIERDRTRELQAKLERIDDQWKRRLDVLRVNHESIKTEYERTISNLLEKNRYRPPKTAPVLRTPVENASLSRDNEILRKRVADLEARIESLKHYHFLKSKKVPPPVVGSSQSIQRFREAVLESNYPPIEMSASCPPLQEREISVTEWAGILRLVLAERDRSDIADELCLSDYRKSGLIERSAFVRSLTNLPTWSIQSLVGIYGFGDDQVDYKSFLSDLATRQNVFASDIEHDNQTLRSHIESLMAELRNRIESVETFRLEESLETLNRELEKKDNELRIYKAELNRFLVRNVKRVGPGT